MLLDSVSGYVRYRVYRGVYLHIVITLSVSYMHYTTAAAFNFQSRHHELKLGRWTLSMSTCCLYLLEKLFEASIMMSRGPQYAYHFEALTSLSD